MWSLHSDLLLIFQLSFFFFPQLGNKSFVKYIFCEYFCPVYGLHICFLNGPRITRSFSFDEILFTELILMPFGTLNNSNPVESLLWFYMAVKKEKTHFYIHLHSYHFCYSSSKLHQSYNLLFSWTWRISLNILIIQICCWQIHSIFFWVKIFLFLLQIEGFFHWIQNWGLMLFIFFQCFRDAVPLSAASLFFQMKSRQWFMPYFPSLKCRFSLATISIFPSYFSIVSQ